jgi:soluble lytic murein transglycosylase-like protein
MINNKYKKTVGTALLASLLTLGETSESPMTLTKGNNIKINQISTPIREARKTTNFSIPEDELPYTRAQNNYPQQQNKDTANYLSRRELKDYVENAFRNIRPPSLFTPEVLERIVLRESSGNTKAFFPNTGARGLMQITEEAWNQINRGSWGDYLNNVFNPEKNIITGTKYLKWAYYFCKNNHPDWDNLSSEEQLRTVLGAYNEGPNKLRKNNWEIKNTKYSQGIF